MIRVLLVEDHETVRNGLRLLIESQEDMQVVGEAANGRVAVEKTPAVRPHVIVMDLSMPEMNGLAATRALKVSAPGVAVVTLTRHTDQAYVQELLAAGTVGYVLKQSAPTELLRAIRAAADGRQYLDASLAGRASGAYPSRQPHHKSGPPRLTDREMEVLRLMALGHSNKEIGASLKVSVKTVEVHKANAMRKLGLRGRIDVVRFALMQGWLQDA